MKIRIQWTETEYEVDMTEEEYIAQFQAANLDEAVQADFEQDEMAFIEAFGPSIGDVELIS